MRISHSIRVFRSPLVRHRGLIVSGALRAPCALGRSGVRANKREGDGATPRAVLKPKAIYFRQDRWRTRPGALPLVRIKRQSGWCDDVRSHRYNRPIDLPCAVSHETLWREDGLYDIVIETDWNRRPAIRGRGSAIFIHLARPGFGPTEGCIALDRKTMALLLSRMGPSTRIHVA